MYEVAPAMLPATLAAIFLTSIAGIATYQVLALSNSGAAAPYHRGVATPTIYEWGGGREAFARWLNRFYDLVEQEAPEIAAMFGGRVSAEHREHVTDWWTEVMGGPATYTERRGGYEHMLARHHDLAIGVDAV